MHSTKLIIILLLTTIYLITPSPAMYGFGINMPIYGHFTHPFFHASFVHLVINLSILYGLLNNNQRKSLQLLSISYTISVFASFFSSMEQPTIGLSGIVYALSGIYVGNNPSKRNVLLSFIAVSTSFILNGTNPFIHLYSWLIGFVAGMILKFIRRYKSDVKGIIIRKQ